MTDFGGRGEIRPPGYIEDIEVSRMAVFVAAIGILIERARHLPDANGTVARNDTAESFL